MHPVDTGPITPDERATIIELIQAGHSRNDIAQRTNRGTGTISRIAKSIGHDFLAACDARTQSSLARAHAARSAFTAERRADIAARLTAEADLLLEGLHGEYLVFSFGGRDNDYNEHTLPEPPTDAKFTIMRAVGTAMKTVLDIDRHDNRADEGLSAVDSWLRSIAGEGAEA